MEKPLFIKFEDFEFAPNIQGDLPNPMTPKTREELRKEAEKM